MKKLLFLIAILSISISGCESPEKTTDQKEIYSKEEGGKKYITLKQSDGVNVYMFFETKTAGKADLTLPTVYYDVAKTRPIVIPYFMCSPGVYTNGVNTYTVTWNVACGSSGASIYLDDFCQCAYCYTTAWGGSC